MEPNKDTTSPTPDEKPASEQTAPADALSRTPDDLQQEEAEQAAAKKDTEGEDKTPAEKKPSRIKQFFKRINVYLLLFILLVAVVGIGYTVYYLNSQDTPVAPGIASQGLTEDALKQLANTDASVGSASQTLTIQGNTVIDGQTLMRANLNVAGNIQAGGSIQGSSLTVSGSANLGETQTNSLQVASNAAVQGNTTLRDVAVAGSSNFSGPMTAAQITVSRIVMSGNAVLEVPNHLAFTGPTPNRTGINGNVVGRGGSVSLNGSDTSGTININTGTGTTAGCFARIDFAQSFSSQPRVIISPVGAAAGRTAYYVDRSTSGFSLCTSEPAPVSQAFAFDYFVAGQ